VTDHRFPDSMIIHPDIQRIAEDTALTYRDVWLIHDAVNGDIRLTRQAAKLCSRGAIHPSRITDLLRTLRAPVVPGNEPGSG